MDRLVWLFAMQNFSSLPDLLCKTFGRVWFDATFALRNPNLQFQTLKAFQVKFSVTLDIWDCIKYALGFQKKDWSSA